MVQRLIYKNITDIHEKYAKAGNKEKKEFQIRKTARHPAFNVARNSC